MDLQRPTAPSPYEMLPRVPHFALSSPDLTDGQPMNARFAVDGDNVSPTLVWSGFPAQTQSFVVNCFDPDAPTPSGYWHWTIADLGANVTELEQGAGESDLTLPGAAFHVRSDGGAFAYEGAGPPPGDIPHRYVFAVHALDIDTLDLASDDSPTKVAFMSLFHTLARATLTVTYQR